MINNRLPLYPDPVLLDNTSRLFSQYLGALVSICETSQNGIRQVFSPNHRPFVRFAVASQLQLQIYQ